MSLQDSQSSIQVYQLKNHAESPINTTQINQRSKDAQSSSSSSATLQSAQSLPSYWSSLLINYFFRKDRRKLLGVEAQKAIMLATVQCIVIGILELVILVLVALFSVPTLGTTGQNGRAGFLFVYVLLYILGQFFQLSLAFDAAKSQNTVQAIGVAMFNLAMQIYSVIQVFQINQNNSTSAIDIHFLEMAYPISIVSMVLMLIFNLYGIYLAFKVYKEYNWSAYEHHGASLEKKRQLLMFSLHVYLIMIGMLRVYHAFDLLLKLSIYFNFGIIVQAVAAIAFDSVDPNTPQLNHSQVIASYIVAAFLVILALAFYHLGRWSVIRCSNSIIILFLILVSANVIGLSVGLIYVKDNRFRYTIAFLTFFILCTIFLNVFIFIYGILCWCYFEDGLKELGLSFFH